MSDVLRREQLAISMLICGNAVSSLLSEIGALEINPQISSQEKLEQIKIIREELNKLSVEIDNIKKEIKLLDDYGSN